MRNGSKACACGAGVFSTRRPTLVGCALAAVYVLALIVLAMDLLVWRPF